MLHTALRRTAHHQALAGLALLLAATGCSNATQTVSVTPLENQSAEDVALDQAECARDARWIARAPEIARAVSETQLPATVLRAVWLGGYGAAHTGAVVLHASVRVAKHLNDATPAAVYRACMASRGYSTGPTQ